MTTLSISLTDDQFADLAALAQAQHKTPEEAIVEIVQAALPAEPSDNAPSILDILGIVETNGVPDSHLHDQIIAEEAMNSHQTVAIG
jgi:hypothetical protein